MPVKYIPYVSNTIECQAVLDNFARTRRVLRCAGNDRPLRGLPLYEVRETETVESPVRGPHPPSPLLPILGEGGVGTAEAGKSESRAVSTGTPHPELGEGPGG